MVQLTGNGNAAESRSEQLFKMLVKLFLQLLFKKSSSGDEIGLANVNFLYDDIVHALKMQQTLA